MNILLEIISIIFCFSSIVLIERFFKKEGLFVWISIATITANILVCKTINILGFTCSLGNVVFASVFLASDILTEKYSSKESKKAILLGMLSNIIFIICTQLALLYTPDSTDLAQDSMKTLFSINLRTSISSIVMFFLSSNFDIWIYEKLKEKSPNKLWLRNNISTIISNCAENYLFVFFAFVGIFDISTIISIATTTTIFEIIIALLDTPFIYLSKKSI